MPQIDECEDMEASIQQRFMRDILSKLAAAAEQIQNGQVYSTAESMQKLYERVGIHNES